MIIIGQRFYLLLLTLCHLEQIANKYFMFQIDDQKIILMAPMSLNFNFFTFATKLILYIIEILRYFVTCIIFGGGTTSWKSKIGSIA